MEEEKNELQIVYYQMPVMVDNKLHVMYIPFKEFDSSIEAFNFVKESRMTHVCICGFMSAETFNKNYKNKPRRV